MKSSLSMVRMSYKALRATPLITGAIFAPAAFWFSCYTGDAEWPWRVVSILGIVVIISLGLGNFFEKILAQIERNDYERRIKKARQRIGESFDSVSALQEAYDVACGGNGTSIETQVDLGPIRRLRKEYLTAPWEDD